MSTPANAYFRTAHEAELEKFTGSFGNMAQQIMRSANRVPSDQHMQYREAVLRDRISARQQTHLKSQAEIESFRRYAEREERLDNQHAALVKHLMSKDSRAKGTGSL